MAAYKGGSKGMRGKTVILLTDEEKKDDRK